jgi:hypothetical protein
LEFIAHSGYENDHGNISHFYDFDLILAHSDRFDQYDFFPCGIQHGNDVLRRPSQSTQLSSRSHTSDKDTRVIVMGLHADAIRQHGTAAEWTRRVDSDNAHGSSLPPIGQGQFVHQSALATAWRPCHTDHQAPTRLGENTSKYFPS